MEYLIVKYFTKKISEEELSELITWLEEDLNRKKLFFEMKDVYDSGNLRPTSEDVENLWNRVCFSIGANSLEKQVVGRYSSKHLLLKKKFACAASIAASIAVFFSVFFLYQISQQNIEEDKIALSEVYVPAGSGVMNLVLSDGTKVYLKSNTRFKFPVQFDKDTRETYLDGEAFFDVAHNEGNPFIISTNKQKIEVLGTSFNIRDHRSENIMNTTLITGKVKLEIGNNTYTMYPHQQLAYDRLKKTVSVSEISPELSNAFSSRKYHFKEKALLDLFRDIERLYGVEIHLQKKNIGTSKYTGTFSLDQSITEILDIINYKTQFAYGIKEKHLVTIY